MGDGGRNGSVKGYCIRVRCFQLLENCFNPLSLSDGGAGGSNHSGAVPKIGDVMYSDLSYGSANDYNGSKTAAGVVTWVSEDGKSAKIMNLKNLTFSSYNLENNFDPDNPYGGSSQYTRWSTGERMYENIEAIEDCPYLKIDALLNSQNVYSLEDVNGTVPEKIDAAVWQKQYNDILKQYDMLIKDASYKGINLLQKQNLQVRFNEDRSSALHISGRDVSSAGLGLNSAVWETQEDIEKSLEELYQAVGKVRSLSSEFGNNYSVVQSRQDFTENMINILTEGADKLTLADMNEESAIMLALQTRQQLAINSLSLASQSSQSVLRLFA